MSSCKVVIRSNRFLFTILYFESKFPWDFQVNQVGQVTEDEEQEPDSGEEETQVRKRKPSILRSNIHLFRCKRFLVSREDAKKLSRDSFRTK